MKHRPRTLQKSSTDAEAKLWHHLRDRQLAGFKFRRQLPLGPYVVDFVCLQAKLIVEVDGGQHAVQRQADESRTAFLREQGFRVMRYWNNEVLAEIEGVLTQIQQALESGSLLCPPHFDTPHPRPLPQGEREGQRTDLTKCASSSCLLSTGCGFFSFSPPREKSNQRLPRDEGDSYRNDGHSADNDLI